MVNGRIKWFGGFNKKLQKINDYGFITLEEADIDRDIYVNRREIPEDLQTLLEGENGEGVYVGFDLEENSQGFQAINVELKTYTGVISSFWSETGEIATKSDDCFYFQSSQSFSFGDYVCFSFCHNSKFNRKEAIKVKKIPRDAEYNEIINICLNSNNYKIATPFIKHFYKDFFQIVQKFNNSDYPYAQYLQQDWKQLYQEVRENEDDKQLIKKWEPAISTNEFKYAKMVSARGAEKLIIKFCEALGYEVEDISIHQITKQSSDWKLADIRLNKKTLLDVKNSRFTVNSKVYSEFCVPEFKQERTNEDKQKREVYIVGVLSPYLQKRFIDAEEPLNFSVEKPKVLGIFYKKSLEELKNIVDETDRLEIDVSRLENFYRDSSTTENYNSYSSRGKNSNFYLPHWLFDYGEKFYEEQIRIIEDFNNLMANLSDAKIPSWEDVSIVGINPLPLFIFAKQNLPTEWESHLPKWKLQFINYLINVPLSPKKKIISLSHLFISILKHFLQMLEENNSEYSPQEYLSILYQNSQRNHPLKIYDPLQTIHSFCKTLQTLWENREKTKLSEFKMFKFRHEGILQGKKASDDSWKTIIAYCGGKIEKKGKCGYSPLILGIHKSCSCGLLICPVEDCQFCQQKCQSYLLRKEKNIINLDTNYDLPIIEF
ncbi:MAG: cold shock domain-containing protein [Trichodesmium sp. MO_231.B1]|nr:cold shock domain-containing protein [Trichodesmium sp. MO_231.B1]